MKCRLTVLVFALVLSSALSDEFQPAVTAEFIFNDWLMQDSDFDPRKPDQCSLFKNPQGCDAEKLLVAKVLTESSGLGSEKTQACKAKLRALVHECVPGAHPDWKSLYQAAARHRRAVRLANLARKYPLMAYTQHYDMGGSHYAYTEQVTDAKHPELKGTDQGAALCLLTISVDGITETQTLVHTAKGTIRDPDVSFDSKRILFAMRHSIKEDDFHLYEYDLEAGETKQLTQGLGYADYEAIYLPNGKILFNSTRCVQIVDCFWTLVSNLYACDLNGQNIHRLSFDQVHTNYPQLTGDGQIIYTRWDYNDRGQIYPQPLFVMNQDGTAQTEYYGNNSWFPTSILHAREIPGTRQLIAVLSGHHSRQRGHLAIIDRSQGRQEAQGVQLIAPVRKTEAVRIDAYGQRGDQFQYPYPVSATEFVVTMRPEKSAGRRFGIYWIDQAGRREVLAYTEAVSSNQPTAVTKRILPAMPSNVDYTKSTGTYFMHDIYVGPGLAGVPRGRIKALRVVALEFRPAGIGAVVNRGPEGAGHSVTPISIGGGAWDIKHVLGETPVYEDGSACFEVPARLPVYFQALDENRHVVQTMRSWSTLQPGETISCIGCHENEYDYSLRAGASIAMQKGPQKLAPFYGPPRGFSFPREIQPILNRHCISCHNNQGMLETRLYRHAPDAKAKAAQQEIPAPPNPDTGAEVKESFSLTSDLIHDPTSKRFWSHGYLGLVNGYPANPSHRREYQGEDTNEMINWIDSQSGPPIRSPYTAGAAKSKLLVRLREGHYQVELSQEELDKLACWIDLLVPYCGDYTEDHAWSEADLEYYQMMLRKREAMERLDRESIRNMVLLQ